MKVATSLLDRNKTVFEILLKNMAIKSLVLQLNLMTLEVVYIEICARENVPVYCNKETGVDMQNHAVAGVKHYVTWNSQEFKAFVLTKMNHIIH